jgi:ArsR family transcriptional regulator, arsenate/arsenite/antimonite-responsive transcriptional repressor
MDAIDSQEVTVYIYFVLWRNTTKQNMKDLVNITKALADGTRIRVLLALRPGELCACQITELFGLAPSTMSKHLYLLKQAGLVDSRKDGRWIYYRLPGKEAPTSVKQALEWVHASLEDVPRIREDVKTLRAVLKCDPADLCKKQCRC